MVRFKRKDIHYDECDKLHSKHRHSILAEQSIVESVSLDDPVLEMKWEDLHSICSQTSINYSLKNSLSKFLSKFGKSLLLDDIYNAVVSGLDSLVSSGKFDGFLAHPDVHYRGKTLPSIDNKLQRNIDAERPLEKVFNDLIGIRIIIEDYTVWEKVKPKIIASNATIVDLRNGKVPDDGYRAVHVYFQADHKHYPIELQFVSEKDSLFNSWQHDYFYKNSQLSPEIGLKLRNLYDLGIITTEQDYRNELHKCSTNTIVEHTIISGTKLVANRFGVKGSVGYVPKSNEELITLYKELSKEMKQNHIDVGISIVKGNGFAEFQPCTIYNTYSSFYDAIFYDLLRRPEIYI